MHQFRKDAPLVISQSFGVDLKELGWSGSIDTCSFTGFDRFRLVDCEQLCKNNILFIHEMNGIPDGTDYVTISYPWIGVHRKAPTGPQILVWPYGCAISTDILLSLCSWVLKENVKYIWIDLLCNHLDKDADVPFQTECLARIYKSSTFCVVLPGGLQHWHSSISTLEESPWMSRLWSLMEVLAAPKTHVLFQNINDDGGTGQIELESSLIEDWLCDYQDLTTQRSRLLLLDALSWRDLSSQEKMSDEMLYFRNRTVWKCAFVRNATRPEDLLPGMLCVLSDTRNYKLQFDKKVSDPQCNDVDVLAFRDAVSSTGPDMSRKWKSFINRMKLPTMTIPEVVSRSWRALPVRGYSMSV